MSTLLAIHSYGGASNQVAWSWPHYCLPGWDLMIVDPIGQPTRVPADGVPRIEIGRPGRIRGTNLCEKLLGTLDYFLTTNYDDCCIIEYDGLFLAKPPAHPGGIFTHHAGSFDDAHPFFHTPWWIDRDAASALIKGGHELLGSVEMHKRGVLLSPDVFLGRVMARAKLPWTETGTWSCNGGLLTSHRASAEAAARSGTWYMHGFRRQEELAWILAAGKS